MSVFGGLENALRDLTTLMQLHMKDYREHRGKDAKERVKIVDQINAMHLDVVKLADAFFKQATAENITLGATVDAREALDRARGEFDVTRTRLESTVREMSQSFPLHKRSADEKLEEFDKLEHAPRFVRVAAMYLTDLGWRYLTKFAISTLTAGAALKILWENVSPFIPGVH